VNHEQEDDAEELSLLRLDVVGEKPSNGGLDSHGQVIFQQPPKN
jgi:hypothetical protein